MKSSDMLRETIAHNIREYRHKTRITQRELAEKIGISPASLSAYETGIKTPPLDIAIKIAQGTELSINELIGNVGDPPSDMIVYYGQMIFYLEFLLGPKTLFHIYDDADSATLHTDDKEAIGILKLWKNVLDLYRSDVIDREIYDAWLYHKMSEYDRKIIPGMEKYSYMTSDENDE